MEWTKLKGSCPSVLLDYFGLANYPVDILKLCRKLGFKTVWKPMDADAELCIDSKQIRVKEGVSENRMRFSLAHEVGHLMMHDMSGLHVDVFKKNSSKMERQANAYAAQLLMPAKLLLPYYKMFGRMSDDHVSSLAVMFKVSPESMEYRLILLGWYKQS